MCKVGKGFAHQLVGKLCLKHMLVVLLHGLDKLARIHPLGSLNQGGDNERTETLTVAHDGMLCLLAEVMDEEHTKVDAAQLLQQCVHLIK